MNRIALLLPLLLLACAAPSDRLLAPTASSRLVVADTTVPPPAPSNLTAVVTKITHNDIAYVTLTWTDNSGGLAQTFISRYVAGGLPEWQYQDAAAPGVTTLNELIAVSKVVTQLCFRAEAVWNFPRLYSAPSDSVCAPTKRSAGVAWRGR